MFNKFFLNLIIFSSIFLISCNKKADIPSYLVIDKFEFEGDSLNLAIQDAWVYINNEFKGTYPLPAKIPVYLNGEANVEIKPGVILFEQKGIRVKHPFLVANDTILSFIEKSETNLTPKLKYSINSNFLVRENFEQDNDLLKIIFNGKDSFPEYRFANNQSFGDFSGRFTSHNQKRSKITLKDSIYFKTTENWVIELDYLNKVAVEFGVEVFKNGVWDDYPILLNMPPVNNWQKTYFNPMPYLKDAMSEGYFRFYVLVYVNNQIQEVFLDNLHIIKQID
jgi:hypothetical protein